MCGGFWFYVALIKNAFVCCVHKNKEKQIKCRGQRGVSACLIVYVWAKWTRLGEDRVSVLCEDVKHSAQWWKSTVKVPVKGWRDFFCWQVRQSQRINRVLTLHAQPIGAVLRLEHHALTVLSPVFGCWVAAFSPPPVGALCPTGGPLTPLCPQAIHYHITDRTDEGRAKRDGKWEDEDEFSARAGGVGAVDAQTGRNLCARTESHQIECISFMCTWTQHAHVHMGVLSF